MGRALGSRRSATLATVVALALAPVVAVAVWIQLPLPAHVASRERAGEGVTVEDRHGLALRSTRTADGSQARWVPYAELDPDLINAFVATEDRRFWEHGGVDVRAAARAVRDGVRARRVVSGASTITMQLARLVRPPGAARRDWGGKLAQALWALRLERHLTKQEILEQYLNRVHLGQGTVGVGAAAALYLRASAAETSVGEAALLAGLASAPSRDNPHVSPRRARARRRVALARMERLGYASHEDAERARGEPLATRRGTPAFLAPHFTTRVVGWNGGGAAVSNGASGAVVRTSLDLGLQAELEAEVRHTVAVLRGRGVEHAALVVLDNETGEVLAWVGSPDFWDADDGQTDMVVSPRQPGSALKPFLFALAFDRGFTAASVLPDVPRTYATATGGYQPRNYDRRFRGPVRAREALASSYNVPAVELAERLGTGSLLHTLRLAGFASLRRDAEHYGLGLSLGNGDVTLVELANGYRALANGGVWRPWTWRVSAHGGASRETRRVVSPLASAIVLDVLSDPAARIPGFGRETPFDFPFPVAVKTGTSRHFTDNWAVGTTRRFTVAAWAGNFSGRPMEGVSGITGAGPLLHRAVMAAARRYPPGSLTTPAEAGAVAVPVCRLSGMRATDECERLTEWFAPGTEPKALDDWERGGQVRLPDEYAAWAASALQPAGAPGRANDEATAREMLAGAAGGAAKPDLDARSGRFRIVSPLDGDRYAMPIGVPSAYATLAFRAAGRGAEGVRWFVDDRPWSGERWPLAPGAHVVRARSATGETRSVRIVVEAQ